MTTLQGKVAIVTGAGRGIGRSIAYELGKHGAKVVVNYAHSEAGAQSLVGEMIGEGMDAIAIQADVSVVKEIESMTAKVISHFGRIDILVNNAGVDPTEDFLQVTEGFWDRVIDTNLKGTFFCTQACVKEMIKTGKGRVIHISSVHGNLTMPRYSAYAATKGGINALTRQLALDLAPFQITVNAVAPGAVEVEKFTDVPGFSELKDYIPVGRIGVPRDIASFVRFIASDESDYFTGQIVTVDGGSSTKLFLSQG